MTCRSPGARQALLRTLAALIPYPVVLFGLFFLHNAWVTILLYHACMLVFMAGTRHSIPRPGLGGLSIPLLIGGTAACSLAGPAIFLLWPVMPVEPVKPVCPVSLWERLSAAIQCSNNWLNRLTG